MPRTWTPLDEVRLFWDQKTDTIKVTSSDPRLGGESFVMQLTPNTHADQLARQVLMEAGVGCSETSSSHYRPKKDHQPQSLVLKGVDSSKIILGHTDDLQPLTWDVPDARREGPMALGVFGLTGSGKSSLIKQIIAQVSRFPEFETYVYDSTVVTHHAPPKSVHRISNLRDLSRRLHNGKRRMIVIDGYNSTDAHQIMTVLRAARSQNDVVIIASQRADRVILNLCDSAVLIGRSDVRQRAILNIDSYYGSMPVGEGVVIRDFANGDTGEHFFMYEPEIIYIPVTRRDHPSVDDHYLNNNPPRQLSTHAEIIPLGAQGEDPDDRVNWDIRYFNSDKSLPTALGIFGKPGSGKSMLAKNVLTHALRFSDAFEVYVCSTWRRLEDTLAQGTQIDPEDLANLPAPKPGQRRFVIIDSADAFDGSEAPHHVRAQEAMREYLEGASSTEDIVVFTANNGAQWDHLVGHFVAVGSQHPEQEEALGTANYGLREPGDAVLIYAYENEDPQERSAEAFSVYRP